MIDIKAFALASSSTASAVVATPETSVVVYCAYNKFGCKEVPTHIKLKLVLSALPVNVIETVKSSAVVVYL